MLTLGRLEIEMDGGDTVRENVVVAVAFPDLPVRVTRVVPNATELLEERVRTVFWAVVPLGLTRFGESEAVTPVGKPEMDKLTGPANPLTGLTETVIVVNAPAPITWLPGF